MTSKPSNRSPLTLGETRTERIVVPVLPDRGHDPGVDLAVAWATRWHLPIHLVTVDEHSDHLARTRDRLAAQLDVEVTSQALAGTDVATSVAAEVTGTDLTVMSTAGGDGRPTTSHAWQLLQQVPGPVLLVGPRASAATPGGAVVIGLDGSPLAEAALGHAVDMARALDDDLWVVQVADEATVGQVQRLQERGEAVSASAYVRDVAERYADSGPKVGWEVVQSQDTARALTDFALDRRAGVIVTSTHGRSGLRTEALGSTCIAIVAQSTVPVLALVPSTPAESALAQ